MPTAHLPALPLPPVPWAAPADADHGADLFALKKLGPIYT